MTEVGKNTRNPGMSMGSFGKSTNSEAVAVQVQVPRGLKNADINRLVAIIAGELRHQST